MKVGIIVKCVDCGRMKVPRGRSEPPGSNYCRRDFPKGDGCPGYDKKPYPGDLWPGETDVEFGYPIGPYGIKEIEVEEMFPCECGCGKVSPRGSMEIAHPENYRYERG